MAYYSIGRDGYERLVRRKEHMITVANYWECQVCGKPRGRISTQVKVKVVQYLFCEACDMVTYHESVAQ